MQDEQHGLGLGHKLDAVNNRMCIVFLVVSSVGLLKRLFITVWKEEQPYAKEGHESAGFFSAKLISTPISTMSARERRN